MSKGTTELASAPPEAELIRDELIAIADTNDGRLDPAAVVEAASDPASALHSKFTWDDTEAARRCRLWEAAILIRRVKITIVRHDPETRQVRVEKVRELESPQSERSAKGEPAKGGSYIRAAKIAKDPEMRASMVATVVAELQAIRKRYARISELESVWAAIDEAAA